MGLRVSSSTKRIRAAALGFRLYFCCTKERAGIQSRAVSLSGSKNWVTIDIYWKILQIDKIAALPVRPYYHTGTNGKGKNGEEWTANPTSFIIWPKEDIPSPALSVPSSLPLPASPFPKTPVLLSDNSPIQINIKCTQIQAMDEYFGSEQFPQPSQPQYTPPESNYAAFDFPQTSNQPAFNSEPLTFSYGEATNNSAPQDEFNDFEEDETTRRIREEEERIQNLLREKSEREWQEKEGRKSEGRRQLEEYLAKKEQEKLERASENLRKESISKEELSKLNVQAGWRKVITNINVRQGEHKGSKDTNRMREAILHRRQDDKR